MFFFFSFLVNLLDVCLPLKNINFFTIFIIKPEISCKTFVFFFFLRVYFMSLIFIKKA